MTLSTDTRHGISMAFSIDRTHWISLAFAAVAAAGGAYLHRGLDGDTRSIISVDQFDLHTDLLVADPDVGRHAGRIAQLVGTLRPERTLLLADQPMYGRSGVYVLTPFELRRGQGRKIVVMRGWMPTDKALASDLPGGYAAAKHEVVVTGRLETWPQAVARSPGHPGLLRERIGLDDFYGPSRPDLMPLILREAYTSDWSASDRQNNPIKMHWPEFYPRAARNGVIAKVLLVLSGFIVVTVVARAFLASRPATVAHRGRSASL